MGRATIPLIHGARRMGWRRYKAQRRRRKGPNRWRRCFLKLTGTAGADVASVGFCAVVGGQRPHRGRHRRERTRWRQGEPASHGMLALFEPGPRFDERGPHFPIHRREDAAELDARAGIEVLEVGEVPSLVEAPVGLCDEEPCVLADEEVAEVAGRFADADDARFPDGGVGRRGVEHEDLDLGVDEATNATALGESDVRGPRVIRAKGVKADARKDRAVLPGVLRHGAAHSPVAPDLVHLSDVLGGRQLALDEPVAFHGLFQRGGAC